jgi:peptidoglycan hydrolase-like protein with peptidoglycan-binding domain
LNKTLKLKLKVDGDFGKATVAAVKKWQKAHGLVPDGMVGEKTRGKMGIKF